MLVLGVGVGVGLGLGLELGFGLALGFRVRAAAARQAGGRVVADGVPAEEDEGEVDERQHRDAADQDEGGGAQRAHEPRYASAGRVLFSA